MIPVKRGISVFIGSFLRTVFVYMSATLKSRRFQSLGIYERYEPERSRSPWLRGGMRFRSLDCDGADKGPR
jgi:hypothetical protein